MVVDRLLHPEIWDFYIPFNTVMEVIDKDKEMATVGKGLVRVRVRVRVR
jgi:hypothetical protein